jgi:general secretion pathway protein L
MSDKILGIDIGEDAVKAVLVSRSFKGGYRAVAADSVSIPQAGGVAEAMKKLFENANFRGCPATTALSVRRLSFRNLSLPFKDEKKIRQILAFEVEPLLHFPIEEAIIDFIMVHKGVPSELFVAVAPKAFVQERTAHISEYVKNINNIDIDGVAVADLVAPKSPAGCALLLDVGAEHSVAFVIRDGSLCQIRPFAFGGNAVTRTLAGQLGCDADEAERRKRENLLDGAQEVVAALIERFLSELDNTIAFMKLHGHLQEGPQRIYLTGGGALYAPLQDALSRRFEAPVEALDLLSVTGVQCDPAVRSRWNPLIMNSALALAVSGHKTRRGFNFRIRDAKVRAAIGRLKGTLRWAAAVTALFLILAATDVYLDYRYNRQRLNALKTEIMTLFKTYNPQATRIVEPVSQMRGSILEARKASLGVAEARPGLSSLALLKDISRLAPPETELLLNSFVLDKDMILLKGNAKNFDAVDTLKREFMKSTFFETVAMGAATLTKQGDKVEFEMRITLKK